MRLRMLDSLINEAVGELGGGPMVVSRERRWHCYAWTLVGGLCLFVRSFCLFDCLVVCWMGHACLPRGTVWPEAVAQHTSVAIRACYGVAYVYSLAYHMAAPLCTSGGATL